MPAIGTQRYIIPNIIQTDIFQSNDSVGVGKVNVHAAQWMPLNTVPTKKTQT
jgi:hypothetical protein